MERNRSPYRVDVLRLSDVYPGDEPDEATKAPTQQVASVNVPEQDATKQSDTATPASTTLQTPPQNGKKDVPADTLPPLKGIPLDTPNTTPPSTAEIKADPSVAVQPSNTLPPLQQGATVSPTPPSQKTSSPGATVSTEEEQSAPTEGAPLSATPDTVIPGLVYQSEKSTPQTETPTDTSMAAAPATPPVAIPEKPAEKGKHSAEDAILAKIANGEDAATPKETLPETDLASSTPATEPVTIPIVNPLPSLDTMTELPPDIWEAAETAEKEKVSSVHSDDKDKKPTSPTPEIPPIEVPKKSVVLQATPSEPAAEETPKQSDSLAPKQPETAAVSPLPTSTPLEKEPSSWTPITEEKAPEQATVKTEDKVQKKTATPSGGNLETLRARVVNQSIGTPLTSEAAPANSAGETSTGAERKKKLVQSDLQTLKEAHEVLGKESAATGPVSSYVVDALKEGEGQVETKHAKVIADVAQDLKSLKDGQKEKEIASSTDPVVPEASVQEIPPVEEEVLGKEKVGEKKIPGVLEEKPPETPVSTLPTMRTFRSDVENTITRNRTSVVDMISAEEKKRNSEGVLRRAPQQKKLAWGSYLLMGGSVILLLAGFVVAIMYMTSLTSEERAISASIFVAELQEKYDITDHNRSQIMNTVTAIRKNADGHLGSITEIQIIERITETGSDEEKVVSTHAVDFLGALETRAPASLVRSLDGQMMLGVHETDTNAPFLILVSDYYENTFAGALEWESTIERDLAPFFELGDFKPKTVPAPVVVNTGTSTQSSSTAPIIYETPRAQEPETQLGVFEDMVLNNIETRVLRDVSGEIVLLWVIPDDKILIITTNRRTFEAIRSRMTAFTF